jgi:hypothetical protein
MKVITSTTRAASLGVIFLLFSIATWAQAQTPGDKIPSQLKPPDGAKLILHARAKGDQIYVCKQDGATYSWTLKAPEAQLLDESGQVIGHHFAGPSWQSTDESKVTGKVAARADSPDPESIPWLFLTAADHSGNGLMSQVTHIQRLNTKGGKAPAAGCDASHLGAETRVPYTADYFFYADQSPK